MRWHWDFFLMIPSPSTFMPFVLMDLFRHPLRSLRAAGDKLCGCFVGASNNNEEAPPPVKLVPPSPTTKLDSNIFEREHTRANSTSSKYLQHPTPSTSPTEISPSENGNAVSQLGEVSRRSSLQLSTSKTATLNTGDGPEHAIEPLLLGDDHLLRINLIDAGSAFGSMAHGNPADRASLENNLPQPRPPDEPQMTPISSVLRRDINESAEELGTTTLRSSTTGWLENDELSIRKSMKYDLKLSLRDELCNVQYEPWGDYRYFIPNDDQRRLITPESILRQMNTRGGFNDPELQQRTASMISERCHKLFATLVCARHDYQIGAFLEEGIDDTDLPFVRLDSGDGRNFSLCSRKSPNDPIRCMATWPQAAIREFATTQWCMFAPVFEFTDEIEHYDFECCSILPWIENNEYSSIGRERGAVEGGFGSVWKVKIHPAHQRVLPGPNLAAEPQDRGSNLPTSDLNGQYSYAAVKRLHSSDEESFRSEVAMLKQFRKQPHAHLVKLLATFRLKGRYYLIFPFAKSNLRQYWSATRLPALTWDSMFWILQQCKAITSGLHLVHEQRYTHAPSGDSNYDEKIRYGRHGDMKAENILWFPEQGTEFGQLVIADFGLTDFHKRSTRSDIPAGHITGSPSYEPPELSLHAKISRAYDIWTLGCLYLELVTWIVLGCEGLEKFPLIRTESMSEEPNFVDDTFFTILGEGSPGALSKQAILRTSVSSWIADLHEMPRCSAFIHDLLDLIAKRMLLVDPSARIRIAHLNREIQDMILKAKNDSLYLTEGVPHLPRRRNTQLSSLSALGLTVSIFPGCSEGEALPRNGSVRQHYFSMT